MPHKIFFFFLTPLTNHRSGSGLKQKGTPKVEFIPNNRKVRLVKKDG